MNLETVAFLVMGIAAFVTRILPISISQYPFNNDGMTESRIAEKITESGHLSLLPDGQLTTTHSTAMPAMNVILAYLSSLLGVTPYQCAQILIAVISVLTVCVIYVLAKEFAGDYRAGVVAGLMAVLMGTFVFTTGSAWKEAMGIGFLGLALLIFIRRNEFRYRALCIVIFLTLPLVHHLAALVGILLITYPVVWSWYFVTRSGNLKDRHLLDVVTVAIAGTSAFGVYSLLSLDRFREFSSPANVVLIGLAFAALCMFQNVILSMKYHSKRTYAPIPVILIVGLLILDYYGYFFSYTPSASKVYFVLVASFGIVFGVAWYGTEYALEHKPRIRAVQLALLLAPATILGFGVLDGFSSTSHQIIYRSFDLADLFIFVGAGMALSYLYAVRRKAYRLLSAAVVISLLLSFPFGYYTESLLGVRHDTQGYEVDGIKWLSESRLKQQLISDERLSYIASAITDMPKDNQVVKFFRDGYNPTPPDNWFGAVEASFTTTGVNDYPNGLQRIPMSNYTWVIQESNVFYIGGPPDDYILIFATSYTGYNAYMGENATG